MILEYHKIDTPESPLDPHPGELPARPAAPLGARLSPGGAQRLPRRQDRPARGHHARHPDLRRLLAGPVPLHRARQRLGHRSRVRGSASSRPSRASIRASAAPPRSTCCRAPTRPTASSTSPTWPPASCSTWSARATRSATTRSGTRSWAATPEAVVREQLAARAGVGAAPRARLSLPHPRAPTGQLPQGARLGARRARPRADVPARRHPDGGGRRGSVPARAELRRRSACPASRRWSATSTTGSPTSTGIPASAT